MYTKLKKIGGETTTNIFYFWAYWTNVNVFISRIKEQLTIIIFFTFKG